jgi:hypothetical protein
LLCFVAMIAYVPHTWRRCLASRALPAALVVLAACASNTGHDQATNPAVAIGESGERPAANPAVVMGDGGPDSVANPAVVMDRGEPDSAASDSATSPPVVGDADGCVDIELSSAETTCERDQDCVLVVTGSVCPRYVPTVGSNVGTLCENGAANSSGAARIGAQIAAIPHGNDAGIDFCDAIPGTPRCLQGQCTVCGPGNGPPGCFDAGVVTTVDGSSS